MLLLLVHQRGKSLLSKQVERVGGGRKETRTIESTLSFPLESKNVEHIFESLWNVQLGSKIAPLWRTSSASSEEDDNK